MKRTCPGPGPGVQCPDAPQLEQLRSRMDEGANAAFKCPDGLHPTWMLDPEVECPWCEVERLRSDLREAAETLRGVGRAALVVKTTLDKPYPDDPAQTPWTRFMEAPARAAYTLGVRLSR